MPEMITGAVPVEESVTTRDAFWPTLTFPKLTLVELAASVGVAAFSCRLKDWDTPPAVAVSVAV